MSRKFVKMMSNSLQIEYLIIKETYLAFNLEKEITLAFCRGNTRSLIKLSPTFVGNTIIIFIRKRLKQCGTSVIVVEHPKF